MKEGKKSKLKPVTMMNRLGSIAKLQGRPATRSAATVQIGRVPGSRDFTKWLKGYRAT
jgi:hypothetical protein